MKPKKPGKCEHDRGKFWDCGNAGIVEKILYPNCPYDSKKPKHARLECAYDEKPKRKPKRKPSDKEMIDWLQKTGYEVRTDCAGFWVENLPITDSYESLRKCIRAAMKAEEGK